MEKVWSRLFKDLMLFFYHFINRKIEPRCYNILEKSLLSDVELPNQKLKSNYLSVQSQLMARICQDHASNYGANFLKQLTDLMNSSQDILLITVNALSGIIALCSEGVIDSKYYNCIIFLMLYGSYSL